METLNHLFTYITSDENYQWIFSGIGLLIITGFIQRKHSHNQVTKGDGNVVVGGDYKPDTKNPE